MHFLSHLSLGRDTYSSWLLSSGRRSGVGFFELIRYAIQLHIQSLPSKCWVDLCDQLFFICQLAPVYLTLVLLYSPEHYIFLSPALHFIPFSNNTNVHAMAIKLEIRQVIRVIRWYWDFFVVRKQPVKAGFIQLSSWILKCKQKCVSYKCYTCHTQ